VFENGVYSAKTTGVILLVYDGGNIYEQVQSCAVSVFQNGHWVAASLPTDFTNPVASSCPIQTIPSNAVIYDSSGNSWSVTSGKQIAENGVTQTGTADVILLLYYNGNMYHQNTHCGVWEYENGQWVQVPMPTNATYSIPQSVSGTCPGMGNVSSGTDYTVSGNNSSGTMLMDTTGQFFYQTVSLPSDSEYTGIMTANVSTYATSLTGSGTSNSGNITWTGTLYPGESLSTLSSDMTSTFYWSNIVDANFNAIFYNNSQLSLLAGTWTLPDGEVWSIDSNGDIILTSWPSDVGFCEGEGGVNIGTITLLHPTYGGSPVGAYNIYSFTTTYSGGCTKEDEITTYQRTGLMSLQNSTTLLLGDTLTITPIAIPSGYGPTVQNEVFTATN
jgi:hypothetical protein